MSNKHKSEFSLSLVGKNNQIKTKKHATPASIGLIIMNIVPKGNDMR